MSAAGLPPPPGPAVPPAPHSANPAPLSLAGVIMPAKGPLQSVQVFGRKVRAAPAASPPGLGRGLRVLGAHPGPAWGWRSPARPRGWCPGAAVRQGRRWRGLLSIHVSWGGGPAGDGAAREQARPRWFREPCGGSPQKGPDHLLWCPGVVLNRLGN